MKYEVFCLEMEQLTPLLNPSFASPSPAISFGQSNPMFGDFVFHVGKAPETSSHSKLSSITDKNYETDDHKPKGIIVSTMKTPTTPATPSTPTVIPDDIVTINVEGCDLDLASRYEIRLEAALASEGCTLTPIQSLSHLSSWTRESDDALLEYLNNPEGGQQIKLPWSTVIPLSFLRYQGQLLQRYSMLEIFMRSQFITLFNEYVVHLLPYVDLSNDDPMSLGAKIRRFNRYIYLQEKTPFLDKAISATQIKQSGNVNGTEIPAKLILNNAKAFQARDLAEQHHREQLQQGYRSLQDLTKLDNCFVQAFTQFKDKDSAIYRYQSFQVNGGNRSFEVSFVGESGVDAGGVFREGLSRIVEDLFSNFFPLLTLCPNGQNNLHTGMDKFLPNSDYVDSKVALNMFNFIGKLMAMSIRMKLSLSFDFPLLIWKKIVGEDVTTNDLKEIDQLTWKLLDEIEHCDQSPDEIEGSPLIINQEQFYEKYQGKLKFVYRPSSNDPSKQKELFPGGTSKEVTFDNRCEYCNLVRAAKINEFNEQIDAMKNGMEEVIPLNALILFSAKQLEELVCGNPNISIDYWKQHTEVSSGVSRKTVSLFWKVIESLTPQEQAGLIRFAWGRSRLPTRSEDFTMKMKLQRGGRASLPVSHTCFFSIELPDYQTEEEMRHGLRTAIHYGVGGVLNN